MTIGVKYCGGCNSGYNRSRQVELLKQQFPEHEFRKPADGNVNDIWLIVCGCPRTCVATDGLIARKKLFVLGSPRSFYDVRAFLEAERKQAEALQANGTQAADDSETAAAVQDRNLSGRKVIRIGQEAEYTKTFTREDVEKFAALTGDSSRLHTDAAFAARSIYGKPVVHGVLAASLISTVMGMELPGDGTIFVGEEVRFLKPVFYGDTLTAKVQLIACREMGDQYIGTFSGSCVNQNGETVITAECRQLMTKELFFIENDK